AATSLQRQPSGQAGELIVGTPWPFQGFAELSQRLLQIFLGSVQSGDRSLIDFPFHEYRAGQSVRTKSIFQHRSEEPTLQRVSPDMGISDSRRINVASHDEVRPADLLHRQTSEVSKTSGV